MANTFKLKYTLDWSDTDKVLIELIEKMEKGKDFCHPDNNQRGCMGCINSGVYNAGITKSIKLIEEKREELKDKGK